MKKILACLFSLTILSTSALSVSAADVVVGIKEDGYFLNNGCVLSQKEINQYAGEELSLHYGDVLYINADNIDPIEPGQFNFGENSQIEYLGTAEEYYDNVKELTVTEARDGVLILEDAQNEKYKLMYYTIAKTLGYEAEIYPGELSVGDVGLFVVNPEKMQYDYNGIENEVIILLEITYRASKDDLTLNPVQPQTMKGDASGDTKIDILDVITINRAVLGKERLTEEQKQAADVNGDGTIDGMDSMNIMRYIVGLIDSPDAQ